MANLTERSAYSEIEGIITKVLKGNLTPEEGTEMFLSKIGMRLFE